jgi:dUTP pyrophosphatase
MSPSYYILKIYIMNNDVELTEKYSKMCEQKQKNLDEFISSNGENSSNIDCGIDLFCPNDVKIKNSSLSNKVPMGIKCSMTFGRMFTGYYLYPRSSMGAKTPLRLSNLVGIIDAGYRGELGALLDNHEKYITTQQGMGEESDFNYYRIEKGDRIVQICSPNLTYPIYPILVNNESELGESIRGSDGFGSTGR